MTTSDDPTAAVCGYFNDPSKCQYCSGNENDRLHWRAAHRVVGYGFYRFAIILVTVAVGAVGIWTGYCIGVKLK